MGARNPTILPRTQHLTVRWEPDPSVGTRKSPLPGLPFSIWPVVPFPASGVGVVWAENITEAPPATLDPRERLESPKWFYY